jgi:hypothetical protein
MRELGRLSAAARRRCPAAKLPEAERERVRQRLRDLDPDVILAASQEVLAGGNLAAKVQIIRFIANLELFQQTLRRESGTALGSCDIPLPPFSRESREVDRSVALARVHHVQA